MLLQSVMSIFFLNLPFLNLWRLLTSILSFIMTTYVISTFFYKIFPFFFMNSKNRKYGKSDKNGENNMRVTSFIRGRLFVKVVIAANSKIARFNIYIKQFLAINQWNYMYRFYKASEMFQFYFVWFAIEDHHHIN